MVSTQKGSHPPVTSVLDVKRRLGECIRGFLVQVSQHAGQGPLPDEVLERAGQFDVPPDPALGDLATSVAMALARPWRRAPAAIARDIADHLRHHSPVPLIDVAVAGSGFVNVRLDPGWLYDVAAGLASRGPQAALPDVGGGRRVQVEFVSANPTGPMNVVNARAAAVGDALARLLGAVGYRVTREYYVNDAGRQARLFALSVGARLAEMLGEPAELPPDAYQGEYVKELAEELLARHPELSRMAPEERAAFLESEAVEGMVQRQREDLEAFGVRFDVWFRERSLYESGAVHRTLEELARRGFLYEAEGARWVRTTAFGDDKDRVVVKSDGELTYVASDVAYHVDKFQRGFDHVIDIWGPDHHGYVARIKASLAALGLDPGRLEVIILQLVTLTRSGQAVRMSKRAGEFVTMRALLEEVGPDAARYFFLSRSPTSPLEFDLDLARLKTMENPVYYVQYAHARICSVFRQAGNQEVEAAGTATPRQLAVLTEPLELSLLRALADYAEAVVEAAGRREPHRVVEYLFRLASAFHGFYNQHRLLDPDPGLRRARLGLALACRNVLAHGLGLLGITAPERM